MLKKYWWPILFGSLLTLFTVYVLLNEFVIPRSYTVVEPPLPVTTAVVSTEADVETVPSEPIITDTSYSNDMISVEITTYRQYDTDIYVADIILSDITQLKSAFAKDIYGKNITEATSLIATANSAVIAINGDYYSARSGYVLRNGILYRDTMARERQQDLVIGSDGSFTIVKEGEVTAKELEDGDAWQVLCFGPGLVKDGELAVADTSTDINPRTAIGMIDDLHLIFVVADGRTSQSAGLTKYELAVFMQSLGAKVAYNLDGGGSSTMVFRGEVINNPTSDGTKIKERLVSDIVYVGSK